ncbi:DNA repair protein RecN [Roseicyclus mahoneyensis]|uniref:DNA repair protein RecN n=1 Tax=Roseicyclus mahoneyensis TaxID=164332 RepID=A0A316GIZ9_9RHOB|nr:DNA repair protein RecN [Roseicyclus mahoneyensis]PWK60504.1 DNA replication and repair protein RecN [Roseicyclus mahoneyensis]
MLRHLDIRNMLIIDRLELAFQPGLNVLTGETGAGKSILLDALGFVLGWRGRADLVRSGADQGEVVAEFHLSPGHPARAVLAEAGFPVEDELILRRVNTPEGRKTAWVNDRRASGEVLRALSDTLVELHGQQDDRGLLDPRQHRAMLDQFGALGDLVAATRAAWSERRAALRALESAEARLAEMRAEEDFLRHAVAELDKLDPQPGEEDALDIRRRLMQGAARMREDVARAAAALGLDGAEGAMGDARRWLDGVADRAEGGLDAALSALERALVELGEAQSGVERFAEALAFNPAELEETEDRLFALRGLARKHAVQPDDLAGLAEDLRGRLARLDGGAGEIAGLKATADAAAATYDAAALALRAARRVAAQRLDAAMAAELAPLKMERAVFSTVFEDAPPGPDGADTVTFTVATNPGAPAGPLNKIASGGELSRFLLALKVCLTGDDSGLTMIFDEIDRGVGGATADAVGRRLKALAEGGQVLVVTHSPQVAALGAHHWRVAKQVEDGLTLSRVVPLDAGARVDEVARMLAGDTVTEAAREAARALLAG